MEEEFLITFNEFSSAGVNSTFIPSFRGIIPVCLTYNVVFWDLNLVASEI